MKERRGDETRLLAQQMEAQLAGIRRRLRQRLEAEFARGADLTGPQRLVMAALVGLGEKTGGMSLKELSEKVGLAHSTVSGIVDRLEARGMVERRASDEDRRVTRVVASAAVRQFMRRRVPELTLSPLVRALRRATAAERTAVQDGLNTLERLLDAR